MTKLKFLLILLKKTSHEFNKIVDTIRSFLLSITIKRITINKLLIALGWGGGGGV
jgi:hypothetical protein